MQREDAPALGRLMNAGHQSLRDDFEVSSAELGAMVEIAQRKSGCYGARMTGAGFGGCAVALVAQGAVPGFAEATWAAYEAATGLETRVYVCTAACGAEIVSST